MAFSRDEAEKVERSYGLFQLLRADPGKDIPGHMEPVLDCGLREFFPKHLLEASQAVHDAEGRLPFGRVGRVS